MAKSVLLTVLIGIAVAARFVTAADPRTAPAPRVFAWATFDCDSRDLKFDLLRPPYRQVIVGSSKDLLLAVKSSAKPEPAAIAVVEAQLAKEMKVPKIDWKKYRVMLYIGGPSRFGGEIRLDLWRSGKRKVTAQWTCKEGGTDKTWLHGAAVLVERTEDEVRFEKFRYIDDRLVVQLRD